MSWFGGHFMKGYYLGAMSEFFNFYCQVENSLPETHIISNFPYLKFQYIITGFEFNIGIAIFKMKLSYFPK